MGRLTALGSVGPHIGFMGLRRFRYAVLLALWWLCSARVAGAQAGADNPHQPGASFWQAAGGVATVNWITWAYNWYIQRWPWAKVGTRTWGENLRHGFVWDNDCFLDNQLAHPYHGSLYHSSARASGYGFWGSFPFVAAGSATWELFGENITPSLNDLINTTLGGMALGEVTYRLSSLLGSKRRSGLSGLGRGLGAFALSPIGQTQGLWRRNGPENSAASSTEELASMAVGRRSGRPFVQLAVRSHSPFDEAVTRPYDAFEFTLQLSPDPGGVVRRVGVSGLLARHMLSRSAREQAVFGVFQHYDYEDLSTLEFSGHSVSGGVLYRRQIGSRNRLDVGAHLEGILLAGISSDYGFEWRRNYDLGPGAGARIGAGFSRDGREWLRVDGRLVWLHSLHGSDADHIATFVRLSAAIPIKGPLGLGGDLALTTRRSTYGDFPAVTQRVPEIRGYLTWAPY